MHTLFVQTGVSKVNNLTPDVLEIRQLPHTNPTLRISPWAIPPWTSAPLTTSPPENLELLLVEIVGKVGGWELS